MVVQTPVEPEDLLVPLKWPFGGQAFETMGTKMKNVNHSHTTMGKKSDGCEKSGGCAEAGSCKAAVGFTDDNFGHDILGLTGTF